MWITVGWLLPTCSVPLGSSPQLDTGIPRSVVLRVSMAAEAPDTQPRKTVKTAVVNLRPSSTTDSATAHSKENTRVYKRLIWHNVGYSFVIYIHIYMHAYIHICVNTYTHTYIHNYTHTHTHLLFLVSFGILSWKNVERCQRPSLPLSKRSGDVQLCSPHTGGGRTINTDTQREANGMTDPEHLEGSGLVDWGYAVTSHGVAVAHSCGGGGECNISRLWRRPGPAD